MMAGVTMSVDFSAIPEARRPEKIEQLCAAMDAADEAGHYPRLTVEAAVVGAQRGAGGRIRLPQGDPLVPGAGARCRLAAAGARISVCRGREALSLDDPALVTAVDETRWDLRRKKLFLFGPERMALSIDRLRHYTGTAAETFQRYVLLTNYAWHVEEFRAALPGTAGPDSDGRQMPAWPSRAAGPGRPDHDQHRGRPLQRQDDH